MTNTLLGNNTTHVVDSVAQLKTLDVEPGNYVQTRSYSADYLTTSTKASGGALYEITTVTAYRAKIGNPTWTPDGYGDFTLNNSNVAVLTIFEGSSVHVSQAGAKGDGVTNDTPSIQAALNANRGAIQFDAGKTYKMTTAADISNDVVIYADGAIIIGGGFNSNVDLFTSNAAVDIKIIGGTFKQARCAFYMTATDNFSCERATFDDFAISILNYNADSTGFWNVHGCVFANCEIGVDIQSGTVAQVNISDNKCKDIYYRALTTRPFPFSKKIVSGIWYQDVLSLTGDSAVVVNGNIVEDVTGPTLAESSGGENEVHGIGVALSANVQGDVTMSNNIIRNIAAHSTLFIGDEGLLGRGTRVIMTGNSLYDAGSGEGMLYAKGTVYHKIANNIVECSSGNPKQADSTGAISTGPNCDVTHNKFIGLDEGIVTRAINGNYIGNEFYNTRACISLRLEEGTAHRCTTMSENFAEIDCAGFFVNGTADVSTSTMGAFVITNNRIFVTGYTAIMKAATSFLFQGNHIDRVNPDGSREVIATRTDKTIELCRITDNNVVDFDNGLSTGRFITVLADSGTGLSCTPNLFIKNNYFGVGASAIYIRLQSYTNLVIADNEFFSTSPGSYDGITVSGQHRQENNIGISDKFSAVDIAQDSSVANAVNKYDGREVWDTTNNRKMRARGPTPTDIWDVVDGSASVTPV